MTDQEKNEMFIFRGKEFKVTPEVKTVCERIVQFICEVEEHVATYGNRELPDDVRIVLEQAIEQAVAEAGLDCALAGFLKVRA